MSRMSDEERNQAWEVADRALKWFEAARAYRHGLACAIRVYGLDGPVLDLLRAGDLAAPDQSLAEEDPVP